MNIKINKSSIKAIMTMCTYKKISFTKFRNKNVIKKSSEKNPMVNKKFFIILFC